MFPTTGAKTASLSKHARAGDRHTMSAKSPSVGGIPSRAIGLPWIMFATLGFNPAGHLGPNPYYPSPKVTNIPLDQISIPLLLNICSVASYQFVLKPFTNSYNRTLLLCREHCSTPLTIIKILLMPLTEPDSPLLGHSFCYDLKWVYDNEMFTIRNTLTFSYGGLGKEIGDLHSLREIRG